MACLYLTSTTSSLVGQHNNLESHVRKCFSLYDPYTAILQEFIGAVLERDLTKGEYRKTKQQTYKLACVLILFICHTHSLDVRY